jgi:hypothetical protein
VAPVIVELHRWERDISTSGAAHGNPQRIRAHDLEAQFLVAVNSIQGPAIGVRDLLSRNENRLK